MNTQLERGSILVDSIRYKYKNGISDTLNNLNIKIDKGEFVGLMGRTGSGKTTSLMLLNGLIPHFFEGEFQGNVIANTMNTLRYRIQTLARFICLVMQDPETQIFGITVEKDVAFGPSNLSYGVEKIQELVKKSLKAVGLEGYEKRITAELSGGEKQRLAIAGVLAMEPEILVLDEPTSELDPVGRREIYKFLSQLRKNEDLTILISGHDSEEMLEYTDRILVMENGTIAWDGKPEKLFSDIAATEKFGIRAPQAAEINNYFIEKQVMPKEPAFVDGEKLAQYLINNFDINDTNINISPNNEVSKNKNVVIETHELCFTYTKANMALNNINIKIHKGEFVALIGKNGAGKTTFSKHLNGLLKPTAGHILINGRDIKGISTSILSNEVGYVFQNPDHQIFSATVWDEVNYGLKNKLLGDKEREKRILDALDFVGLENCKDRHPFTLGKGERQKLVVASILAMEPDILVIDEPTTGQDWDGTQRMMKMLEKLHKKGHTILAITHNMQLAAEYADRIIVFSNGRIVLDGNPEEVFYQTEILESASVTPPDCVKIASQLRSSGFLNQPVTIDKLKVQLLESIKGKVNVN